DRVGQITQYRIVFEQMSQRLRIGKVVDRNEFDIAVIERSPEHISPDASESVDSYFNCHVASEIVVKNRNLPIWDGRKMVTGKGRMQQIENRTKITGNTSIDYQTMA